jgi:BMFP domain-containing protein YqiC
MTQTSNRLMDELAKLMTDAAGVAQGVRREIETAVRAQVERFLGDMDVVQREQFEAVREMAARARDDNEELRRRLAELEARVAALEGVGGSAPVGAAAKRGRRGSGGGAGS